jgi:alkanesulfonate monooxygenase SsuD/methylene tetrahydromethanopterin reductase-like flavin-dependent oxidoreductase (luciferase family)
MTDKPHHHFDDVAAEIAAAVPVLAAAGLLRIAEGMQLWQQAPMGLEKALSLRPDWRESARRRARDAMLRTFAQRYCVGAPSVRAAASQLALLVGRYETSGWHRDRSTGKRPAGMNGDAYDILMLGTIPKNRQLRAILADGALGNQ